MDKRYLAEIDSRIRLCLEAEEKLEYLDSLLNNKKVSKLEYEILRQSILRGKSEQEVRNEINNYIEKALKLKNKIKGVDYVDKAKTITASSFTIIVLLLGMFFISDVREGFLSITGLAVAEVTDVILNSSSAKNTTDENLTVYWTSSDIDNDAVYNITDWRINGTSIAVLNMPFEADGDQNATDYSNYGNGGTITGASWTSSGHYGGAYSIDAGGEYIDCGNDDSLNITGKKLTLEAWVYHASAPDNDGIIFKGSLTNSQGVYSLIYAVNQIYFRLNGATSTGSGQAVTTDGPYANDVWHHIVGTYNGTDQLIYVDGAEKASESYSTALASNTNSLKIGTYYSTSYPFTGKIDEVKIYNRALSQEQIIQNHRNRTDLIVSGETNIGENWSACITPNDGTSDGVAVCSNNLTILTSADSIAPIISDVTNISITNESVSINWTTNEVSNTSVSYGTALSLGSTSSIDNSVTAHNMTLTGLTNATLYYYNVTSCDSSDNCQTNGSFNFTTLQNVAVNNPPTAVNVTINSTYALNTTDENLTVYWTSSDIDNDAVYNITDWRINGTSIAVLNMPFENHSNSANNATDYSTNEHNGSVHGATWNLSGYYGGAYMFDGKTNYIDVAKTAAIEPAYVTVAAWAKTNLPIAGGSEYPFIAGIRCGTYDESYELYFDDANDYVRFLINIDGTSGGRAYPGWAFSNLDLTLWHHYVGTYDGSYAKLYVDGVQVNNVSKSGTLHDSSCANLDIGQHVDTYYLNGTIDELKIFNRALSIEQILQLYRNRTDLIVSQETNVGENWSACITPNDGIEDGSRGCSANLTILDTDSTGPVITNIEAVSITNETASINWTTNEKSNTSVSYGTVLSLGSTKSIDDYVSLHNITITGLSGNTFYYYNVTSCDFWGNCQVNGTFNFTTLNTPPYVLDVILNSSSATNTTTENLTIYWTSTDVNDDKVYNITDWRINGTSIAMLNMPFGADGDKNGTDYSTYGNDVATVSGNPVWSSTSGYLGTGAYTLDGTGDYISTANNPFSNAQLITHGTMMAWVKFSSLPVLNDGAVATDIEGYIELGYGKIVTNNVEQMKVRYYDSAERNINLGVPSLDTWYHLAVTWNGALVKAYIDGAFSSSVAGSYINPDSVTRPFRIGAASWDGSRTLNGVIDDVRVYNRVLSAEQIKEIYRNRTDLIVSQETNIGENWSACITPNDGYEDGTRACSANLTILEDIITLTSIYPNQTGEVQNITDETSIVLTKNYSKTTNLTFNATAESAAGAAVLTFRWFVNGVLKFTEALSSIFTSFFSMLFNVTGEYNVTVRVNASNAGINDTFTFNLTTKNYPPEVNNVILNSTDPTTNYTTENLTVYWNSTDVNSDVVYNITDWRINGTSIAVLNMPFESDGSKNGTDYSSYGNDISSLIGSPFWNSTGGYSGFGAYRFDGINDYLNLGDKSSLDLTDSFTITAWIHRNGLSKGVNSQTIFSKYNYGSDKGWFFEVNGAATGKLNFMVGHNNYTIATSGYPIEYDKWYHVAVTFEKDVGGSIYINGTSDTAASGNPSQIRSPAGLNAYIGARTDDTSRRWNGTIDDIRVYNRVLSVEQIKELYIRQDLIVHNETNAGENWTACITPNDGIEDGTTVCSDNLTIANSPPTAPTLLYPNDGNNTLTNLSVNFNWTDSTDTDSDSLTYYMNLTSQYCADQVFEAIPTSNYTSPELDVVTTCGYYNWTVRAYDGTDFSDYSSIFNFSIQPSIVLNLTQNSSDFGNMANLDTNDTTNNNPQPFVVQSDSNSLVNVSVKALDELWVTEGLGNASFQYKANKTTEPNSFDYDNSQTTFTPITGSATLAVKELKYVDTNDTAAIDIEVTVPFDETAGQKSSNIVIEGKQS